MVGSQTGNVLARRSMRAHFPADYLHKLDCLKRILCMAEPEDLKQEPRPSGAGLLTFTACAHTGLQFLELHYHLLFASLRL